MDTENSKVKAVFAIKNLVYGIANDWKELKSLDVEIERLVHDATTLYASQTSDVAQSEWQGELKSIEEHTPALKKILNKVTVKINNKDPEGIVETWNQYPKHANYLDKTLNKLYQLGQQYLPSDSQTSWEAQWETIFSTFSTILQLAEGSSLHLSMISELAPEELDELTVTIVKHIPTSYSVKDALQYEKEYMDAYEELKDQAKQKKNLWDKFLDILAGGIQQTPAERVMMQRWVNGEKEDL